MELEPGLIDRQDMPFGPRVARDGLFEGLAEPLVGALSGSDPVLFSLQATIAGNVADGLDGTFVSTVGAAEAVTDGNRGAGDDQTAGALVDAGQGSEAYRQSVLSYMPQPEAPIEGDFRDLPPLGSGHPGNGGIDSGDSDPGKE
jgi:hypothetical protein